jgi:uncharacterized protein YdhG (YjbR/CyaY superfamily)
MKSEAPTVAAYLEETPAERKPVLKKLRALCRKVLAGYSEGIQYGMPVYAKGGTAEVAFASQKNYIAIYFLKPGVLAKHKTQLRGVDMGKGCLRFPKAERIDLTLIETLLRSSFASGEPPC